MADVNIDLSKLPEDIRDKLAELDLELSEGMLKIIFDISLSALYQPYTHYTRSLNSRTHSNQ